VEVPINPKSNQPQLNNISIADLRIIVYQASIIYPFNLGGLYLDGFDFSFHPSNKQFICFYPT